MIYIIGHLNPDLDSAVSVIALKYLFDRAKCFGYKNSRPVLAGPANFESITIFKKFKVDLPQTLPAGRIKKNDLFILADHNEENQRLTGIKAEQIIDIYDHHKANLNFSKPIYINIKPWGSTNTIIAWLMKGNGIKPDKKLAALMISAILSDTQGFRSSTTTNNDRNLCDELNMVGNIKNLEKLTKEIFLAKSNIKGMTNKQILTKDGKIFDFKGKKIYINQLETIDQEKILTNSLQLIEALKKIKKEYHADYAYCVITDVLAINSKMFCLPEDEKILKLSFPTARQIKKGVFDLGPLLSRKKDIAPCFEKILT